jgi:hypothetical protein
MADRYPGYDVLKKRNSPSWNNQTRAVIDQRLALDPERHQFFTDEEWKTLGAMCNRIVPQPASRPRPVPIAAMLDEKMHGDHRDGYRDARLPPMQKAWQRGLAALEGESRKRYGAHFYDLQSKLQDEILRDIQAGNAQHPAWGDMPPALFFAKRVLHDLVSAYYSHPTAWNEIGFGGPASPRGYVRLDFDRRDPWEAAEARPDCEHRARKENARVG